MENTKGKTEKSLSVPQYFSWVNHNNDGTTEEITLTNLDFFAWLKREFGMNIEIYAFDAGNFDSPDYKFFDPENEQFKKNFPNGFSKVAERGERARHKARLLVRSGRFRRKRKRTPKSVPAR